MNIKAIFPPGANRLIVNGLHQWDFGRKLEIQSDDLPALVEVHFACAGMRDAVVRSCAVLNGVAEAAIPDQCLEQTTPVTAWVYEVGETSGATVKTVVLPITERTQPQPGATIPEAASNRYTELIAAVNELVESLKAGDVTVTKALQADKATKADSATTATSAGFADEADTANFANEASILSSEWSFVNNGTTINLHSGVALPNIPLQVGGVYIFSINDDVSGTSCTVVFAYSSDRYCNSTTANLLLALEGGVEKNAEVWLSYNNGQMFLMAFDRVDPLAAINDNFAVTVAYKRIV